jgi:RpiB/LacA/LacB family sugar-phosphate isomerase
LINKVLSAQGSMGILICKNGVGVCMMANKFKGIRAGLSWNIKHAVSSRNDDNTNILCLPADYIFEEEALKTVEAWLNTPFSKEERFSRRLKKAGL